MKKVLFCLSLIFGLLVLNQVPSFAMEFTVSPEMIGGLGDLGYGLIGGAEFDFNGTEYVINDYDNLSEALKAQAAEQKAREFLQAYCMSRGIPIPNIDPDLPATTGKEFYKSQYFDSANRTVWNNYKLGRTNIEQQEALRFPISPQAFSDWTGYSNFWYEKYINEFTGEGEAAPDVPESLQTRVDNIAKLYMWATNTYPNRMDYADVNVRNGSYGERFFWNNRLNYSYARVPSQDAYIPTNLLTININQSGEQFIVSCPEFIKYDYNEKVWGYNYGSDTYFTAALPDSYRDSDNSITIKGRDRTWINFVNAPAGTFSTLGDAIDYVYNNYIHVKHLIVLGQEWIVDSAPANPTIPSFPDVIGGNDDDPYPAYDVVFPNTSDYEGTFDITSLFDAIKEAIIGASDTDESTDSTLTREKVTDTYKDKVGEAVGEAVKTIDDVMEDSFPIEGTLNYPNLPPIPIIPLDNAFSGTTILSELIDACQKILPSPLSLAFWGMIFILFIIGLIRILHK